MIIMINVLLTTERSEQTYVSSLNSPLWSNELMRAIGNVLLIPMKIGSNSIKISQEQSKYVLICKQTVVGQNDLIDDNNKE